MPNVAIITALVPATDTRQTRIKASSDTHKSFVPYDYALGVEENHVAAAKAHAEKFHIRGELVHACLPHDRGYAFLAPAEDNVPTFNTPATVNVPSSATPARSEDPVPYLVPGQPINPSAHPSKHEDAVIAEALEILERRVRRDAVSISSPDDLRRYLTMRHAGLDREVFEVIYLTSQNRVIEVERLFTGTLTQTAVYPREVVKGALLRGAAGVILAHNHPSGVPDPSAADRMLTASLKQALQYVDVTVLDHVITAGGQTTSFAERGLL